MAVKDSIDYYLQLSSTMISKTLNNAKKQIQNFVSSFRRTMVLIIVYFTLEREKLRQA